MAMQFSNPIKEFDHVFFEATISEHYSFNNFKVNVLASPSA